MLLCNDKFPSVKCPGVKTEVKIKTLAGYARILVLCFADAFDRICFLEFYPAHTGRIPTGTVPCMNIVLVGTGRTETNKKQIVQRLLTNYYDDDSNNRDGHFDQMRKLVRFAVQFCHLLETSACLHAAGKLPAITVCFHTCHAPQR